MEKSDGRRIKRAIHIKMESIKFCSNEMNERFGKFELISNYVNEREKEIKAYNVKNKVDVFEPSQWSKHDQYWCF